MKSILFRDLTDTSIGGFLVRFLFPLLGLSIGIRAIAAGEMNVRGADISGVSAYLYGAAFVSLGIGLFALPSTQAFAAGDVSIFALLRLWIGLGVFVLLIIAGTVSLF